ncbi:hypothetical protein B0T11DRAFT_285448 [Plectosphaerella cucumerina]|uniref:DUF7728 domain-containing protein n=1 Tax=Plectosphaerella cucumerina TaxID=40658 RepID=A0A8K0TEZ9_9PEZI|nr:hypothetical protein B0T11DRAFT_285448 [Plectosphaerella cucumerina]
MLWKHFSAAAGLAAVANALFIAPEISDADNKIVNALPVLESTIAQHTQTLKLDCPGCPVKMRRPDGRTTTKTDVPSHLELSFAVDTSGAADRLLVNDFELYPNTASWYTTLRAPQVIDLTQMVTKHPRKAKPPTPQLGYALGIRRVPTEEDRQQLGLIEIELQIIEVGYSFNDNVPAVRLKLVETPSGKLMIASVDIEERKEAPEGSEGSDLAEDECQNVFCSWGKSIVKGLKSLRPSCHRGHRGHGQYGQVDGAPRHHPHANHRGRRPGHYRQHHTWGRLLQNITWSIFLPILIGLVAGVGVALLVPLFPSFACISDLSLVSV